MADIKLKDEEFVATIIAVDHGIYPTRQPNGDLTYTVNSNGVDFEYPTSDGFVLKNTFWTVTSNFTSHANYNDNGKTISIKGSCEFGDYDTSLTVNIANPISVVPMSGLTTTRTGGQATFDVRLLVQPEEDVVIPIVSSDVLEGTVDKASLTFTSTNWETYQTVTITGQVGHGETGDTLYYVTVGPSSSLDNFFDQITAGNNGGRVSVTNKDGGRVRILVTHNAPVSSSASGDGGEGSAASSFTLWDDLGGGNLSFSHNSPTPGYAQSSDVTGNYAAEITGNGVGTVELDEDIASKIYYFSLTCAASTSGYGGDTASASVEGSVNVKLYIDDEEKYSKDIAVSLSSQYPDGGLNELSSGLTITVNQDGTYEVTEG